MSLRVVLLLLLCTASVARADADVVEGARFEHRRSIEGQELLLSGTHLSRWAGLLKVSVAGLWLPRTASGREALDATLPRQLEIHYLVRIPGARLRDGTREILARNWPRQTLARHAAGIDALVDAFADVAPGDRYTLTYLPGNGTRLARNGRVVARSDDPAVGALLFAVWLGPQPLDAVKKRDLLALRQHRLTSPAGGNDP